MQLLSRRARLIVGFVNHSYYRVLLSLKEKNCASGVSVVKLVTPNPTLFSVRLHHLISKFSVAQWWHPTGNRSRVVTRYIFLQVIPFFIQNFDPWSQNRWQFWSLIPQKNFDPMGIPSKIYPRCRTCCITILLLLYKEIISDKIHTNPSSNYLQFLIKFHKIQKTISRIPSLQLSKI